MLIQVIKKDGNRGFIESSVQPNRQKDYDNFDGVWFEKKEQEVIIKQKPKQTVVEPVETELSLEQLQAMYLDTYGKKVPNNKKNDPVWIVNKLAE